MILQDAQHLTKEFVMSKIIQTKNAKQVLYFFLLFLSLSMAFTVLAMGSANATSTKSTDSNPSEQVKSVTQITINDIKMEIKSAHQEGEFFQVDVCYSLPDDTGDWTIASLPDDALLKIGDKTLSIREEGILSYDFDTEGVPTSRCEYLLFPIKVEEGSQISITIKKIYTTEPDQVNCEDLQKKLDSKNTGITVQCPTEEQVGGFTVIKNPSEMTFENAFEIAFDTLTDARTGPWDFSFTYTQPQP